MTQATKPAPAAAAGVTNSLLTDFDIYLFNEGTHVRIFQKLGAHVVTQDGQPGVEFAVWAPNADAVSVIGEAELGEQLIDVAVACVAAGAQSEANVLAH